MNRIEVNVQTGERKIIELTSEEVAEALSNTAKELAKRDATAALEAAMTVEQKLARIGLTLTQLKAALLN